MKLELERYIAPVNESLLRRLLKESVPGESQPVDCRVNLSDFADLVLRMPDDCATGRSRAAWDAKLVGPFHSSLRDLPRSLASDLRFWQWLTITHFPALVWLRWVGKVPDSLDEALENASIVKRFLGNPSGTTTLNSISRQALSRLWWCGEIMGAENDYELAKVLLTTQDLYQAVFERRFGLYPPAARAFVLMYREASEEAFRKGARRLNQILTTIVLETLDQDDIMALLETES